MRDIYQRISEKLKEADAIVIGAGAGLSTAAGFIYTGERFEKYFSDFARKYGFSDMYSGGFYPYKTKEEFWGYWSRYIYVNRYMDPPKDTYQNLLKLIKDKDYFVITTNVDHCFQKAGFDRERLFYTQGDYGLFQSSDPVGLSAEKTYDNESIIREMVLAQGFEIGYDNELLIPDGEAIKMVIPSELIPYCEDDGKPMTLNLRSDDSFVEDEGWHKSAERYQTFIRNHEDLKTVYLEIGVGYNTPAIIKYPFIRLVYRHPDSFYICINYDDASTAKEIENRSICIRGDADEVIRRLEA